MARYQSIPDTVGNTPLVKLNRPAPEGINLYLKLESINPMGSVEDPMACAVIAQAEESGGFKPGCLMPGWIQPRKSA